MSPPSHQLGARAWRYLRYESKGAPGGIIAVNGRDVGEASPQPRLVESNPREMLQRILTAMEQCGVSKTPEQLVLLVRAEIDTWIIPGDIVEGVPS